MHRVATEVGGLDLERRLQNIKQSPAELLFVSSADTELAALARIWGPRFGSRLRLMNASLLQHPEAAEHYADHVLFHAKLAIFRLHGGKAYFPKLLDELLHIKSHGAQLRSLVLPGTDEWDPELENYSEFDISLTKTFFIISVKEDPVITNLQLNHWRNCLTRVTVLFLKPRSIPTMAGICPWSKTLLKNPKEGFGLPFTVPGSKAGILKWFWTLPMN